MDAAEWLDVWVEKLDQRRIASGDVDTDPATYAVSCRQDATNDGIDLQELVEAAGGNLAGFLRWKAAD